MGTGLTNLQAADAALQAEVTQILTDIQTALANDDPDAAVQAAADIVNTAVTNLQAGDPAPPAAASTPAASAGADAGGTSDPTQASPPGNPI